MAAHRWSSYTRSAIAKKNRMEMCRLTQGGTLDWGVASTQHFPRPASRRRQGHGAEARGLRAKTGGPRPQPVFGRSRATLASARQNWPPLERHYLPAVFDPMLLGQANCIELIVADFNGK